MIQRMEQAGFGERRRDEQDERISRVYLTGDGRAVLADAKALTDEMEAVCFSNFEASELQQMRELLERVLANLSNARPA